MMGTRDKAGSNAEARQQLFRQVVKPVNVRALPFILCAWPQFHSLW